MGEEWRVAIEPKILLDWRSESSCLQLNRFPRLSKGQRLHRYSYSEKEKKKKKLNYVIPFFIKGVGYELNERFQSAVTAVRKVHVYNGSIAEKISAYSQLVQCVCDFSRIVKKYGELIIAEIPLPLDKKTIKPLPFYGGALLKGKYAQFKFSLLK